MRRFFAPKMVHGRSFVKKKARTRTMGTSRPDQDKCL